MNAALGEPRASIGVPQPKRWTCAEYHRLGGQGAFEGRQTLLIDGEIYEMAPGDPPHETHTGVGSRVIESAFGPGFHVRVKAPLVFGLATDPEPDLAVVTGDLLTYAHAHPTTAVLVIEVSQSSRTFDLGAKASLYAAGGIADYWVVDLVNRCVVVHRDAKPDTGAPFGISYASVTSHSRGEDITPLSGSRPVAVSDLLP